MLSLFLLDFYLFLKFAEFILNASGWFLCYFVVNLLTLEVSNGGLPHQGIPLGDSIIKIVLNLDSSENLEPKFCDTFEESVPVRLEYLLGDDFFLFWLQFVYLLKEVV